MHRTVRTWSTPIILFIALATLFAIDQAAKAASIANNRPLPVMEQVVPVYIPAHEMVTDPAMRPIVQGRYNKGIAI